jgi:hypothetical protein
MKNSDTEKPVNKWVSRKNRPGKKPNRITEHAPSTFQRYVKLGKLPYSRLFRDSVRDLFEYQLSDSTVATWTRLQPMFANRHAYGHLVDDRANPITSEFLAFIWKKDQSEVDKTLGDLVKARIIGQENGIFIDFAMVNCQYEPENDNVPNGNDLDNSPQQNLNVLSQSRVEYSRAEQSRADTLVSANTLLIGDTKGNASPVTPHKIGVTATLSNDGKSSGSVPEPIPAPSEPTKDTGPSDTSLNGAGAVAAAPKPVEREVPAEVPRKHTMERLHAHRDEWVAYLWTMDPVTTKELRRVMTECGAHPDIIWDAMQRAKGLIKGINPTMTEMPSGQWAGVGWLRDQEKAA